MTYREGDYVGHCQSGNHVIALEPPRAVAWATAAQGGGSLGWLWPSGVELVADRTVVTPAYDSTGTSPENGKRFGR
jgi:hypothetical protein